MVKGGSRSPAAAQPVTSGRGLPRPRWRNLRLALRDTSDVHAGKQDCPCACYKWDIFAAGVLFCGAGPRPCWWSRTEARTTALGRSGKPSSRPGSCTPGESSPEAGSAQRASAVGALETPSFLGPAFLLHPCPRVVLNAEAQVVLGHRDDTAIRFIPSVKTQIQPPKAHGPKPQAAGGSGSSPLSRAHGCPEPGAPSMRWLFRVVGVGEQGETGKLRLEPQARYSGGPGVSGRTARAPTPSLCRLSPSWAPVLGGM